MGARGPPPGTQTSRINPSSTHVFCVIPQNYSKFAQTESESDQNTRICFRNSGFDALVCHVGDQRDALLRDRAIPKPQAPGAGPSGGQKVSIPFKIPGLSNLSLAETGLSLVESLLCQPALLG